MKKGQFGPLKTLTMTLVIVGILTAIMVYVLEQIQGQLSGPAVYVTGNGTSALSTIGTWLPIVTIAGVAGVIIYFIMNSLGGVGQKGQFGLRGLVMGLGITAILAAIGAYVVSNIQSKLASNIATNVTSNVTSSLTQLGTWLPIIAIAGVAGVVIYFVIGTLVEK